MLKRSKDRKVTNAVTKGGAVAIANTFGLPSGVEYSCPGATAICAAVCYAGKLEKIYKGVKNVLLHNWELLKDADYDTMVLLLSDMINDFNKDCAKRNADKVFRIHWDGDFFNETYAKAWADVVKANPDVQFWVYTRSFIPSINVIPIIANVSNLAVYLSVDAYNRQHAKAIIEEFPAVKIAALSDTFLEAKEMIKDISGKNGIACPEVAGKIELINSTGSACVKLCGGKNDAGFCVTAKVDIQFAIKGK